MKNVEIAQVMNDKFDNMSIIIYMASSDDMESLAMNGYSFGRKMQLLCRIRYIPQYKVHIGSKMYSERGTGEAIGRNNGII